MIICSIPACGNSTEVTDTGDGDSIIFSSGYTLTTTNIQAASGSVVTIINYDNTPHTVTSQSAIDVFDNSGDFNVEVTSDGGIALLTLPEAESGTKFYFYCRFYEDLLSPSSGTITIE